MITHDEIVSPEVEEVIAKAICFARFVSPASEEYYNDLGWRDFMHRQAKEVVAALLSYFSSTADRS